MSQEQRMAKQDLGLILSLALEVLKQKKATVGLLVTSNVLGYVILRAFFLNQL